MPLLSFYQDELTEAGCDEAGRGCYAGPVYAAAVIIEQEAIAFAVAKVEAAEIDRINILKASFKAMHLALDELKQKPQLLLIDGNRFIKYKRTPHKCFVKGDGRFASIAAASILAKTYRDEYMLNLHKNFPQYNWERNKGYGTAEHRKAIEEFGLCVHHRMSFNIQPNQEEELFQQ